MKQEWVKKWQTGERTQSLKVAASTQSQSPKPSRNLCPTWLDWFFKSQKSGLRHEISRFFHVGNSLKFKLHDKQNTCVRGNHRLGLQLGTCASKLSLPLHTQLRPAAQWEAVLSLLRLPGWHRTFFQDEQEGGFHWPGGTSRLFEWPDLLLPRCSREPVPMHAPPPLVLTPSVFLFSCTWNPHVF